jgi:hypothetical protein
MMLNLLVLIAPLVAGILLGYLLRNGKRVSLDKVTFAAIVVLIFSLGFSIGANNELLNALPRVGLNAIVILLLAVFFSAVLVKAAMKAVELK